MGNTVFWTIEQKDHHVARTNHHRCNNIKTALDNCIMSSNIPNLSSPAAGSNILPTSEPNQGRSNVTTVTETVTATPTESEQPEVLQLTLRAPPSVRWDESIVDNEGLGRKSSKRCCIFHKQRAFGESSTDSSDAESGDDAEGGDNGEDKASPSKHRKIARPKKSDNVPDFQRFHA
jgi:protein phosphatase 1 regulatory subunit 11